jgi:DNA primase
MDSFGREGSVSGNVAFEVKERIKQATDIVDLIGSYLPLRREGRGFKALCPWHDDSRPSLQVNAERQSFRCWVCDIGGDIFSFIMRMEGIEFPEALRMLADRANISLQETPRGSSAPADDKRVLFQAMAWVDEQYHHYLLKAPAAEAARQYLADRHITAESVRRFQLGFAPDEWSWLLERAKQTPYSAAVLEKIGVISRRRQGPGYYDRFKGRVMFPIFDSQARAVGTGGRVLPQLAQADAAKYVNSPETPLFSKSKLLYGLNHARDAIRKTGTALVTEGYTDCIVAHQFGFENSVAVLGTALGEAHIQLLRRFADRIRVILVLDGDEAGRKRAKEVLELFVSANVDLRVLTLPDDADPADYLLAHGAEAFRQLTETASDALEHAFHTATEGIDLQADLHAATAALEQLVATIAKAPRLRPDTQVEDRLREEKFLQRLAGDFRVPEAQVRELMTQLRRKTATRRENPAPVASVREKIGPLERELLELLLQQPQLVERFADVVQPTHLLGRTSQDIYSRCVALWASGVLPEFERLLLEIDDPVVKTLLVQLDETGRAKATVDNEARLRDILAGFERRRHQPVIQSHKQVLNTGSASPEEENALLRELELFELKRLEQAQQRESYQQGISDPTEG